MKVTSILSLVLLVGVAMVGCGPKEDTSLESPTAKLPAPKSTENVNKPAPQAAPPVEASGSGAATVQPQ